MPQNLQAQHPEFIRMIEEGLGTWSRDEVGLRYVMRALTVILERKNPNAADEALALFKGWAVRMVRWDAQSTGESAHVSEGTAAISNFGLTLDEQLALTLLVIVELTNEERLRAGTWMSEGTVLPKRLQNARNAERALQHCIANGKALRTISAVAHEASEEAQSGDQDHTASKGSTP